MTNTTNPFAHAASLGVLGFELSRVGGDSGFDYAIFGSTNLHIRGIISPLYWGR